MNRLLSCAQARQVDAIAIEQFHLPGIVLMENAGRNCAQLLLERLAADPPGHATPQAPVTILAGKGNNAGDGFVIARHLHNQQVPVQLILIDSPDQFRADALINWNVVDAMGIECLLLPAQVEDWEDAEDWGMIEARLRDSAWIVDALLGTGIQGTVRAPYDRVIERINSITDNRAANSDSISSGPRVLAVDLPSGLNGDTGEICGVCVRADVTATFVALKTGMTCDAGPVHCGEIQVLDIGVPRKAVELACA